MDEAKVLRLGEVVRALESAAVAFSAGIDSTLVARVARDELGERAVAVTAVSASLPAAEREEARALARGIGIAHVELDANELDDPRYAANTELRCYFCKTEAYDVIGAWAAAHGYAWVLDGSNLDDTSDDRPGRRAAAEHRVRSPLIEAGFSKDDVRELSRRLGLPNWDKPAAACLASRIPHGTPVTVGALGQIEQAESFLRSLGLRQVRVRHHGTIARIETSGDGFDVVAARRAEVAAELRRLGYRHVALDLAGYSQGGADRPGGAE